MAITAARALPPAPEMLPIGGGRLCEAWRLTGDGSATTVTITAAFIDYIEVAIAGTATNNITSSTTSSVTLTFATAPGNNLTLDVMLIGRKN